MDQLVGYKLINVATSDIIETWGGVWGSCPGIPNPINCLNNDIVYDPALNVDYGGVKLIEWMMSPSEAPIAEISRRQFFQECAIENLITQSEALAAIQTGAIPSTIDAVINQLPNADDQFNARMLICGAISYNRNNPLVEQIGAALGKTDAEIDALFRAAILL